MSRKKQAPATQLISFLVSKVGMKDAIKVATFILCFGQVAKAVGHEPSVSEYCVHWHESQATYYRDLQRFRRVWPNEKSPMSKWEWVAENVPGVGQADDDASLLALLLGPVL